MKHTTAKIFLMYLGILALLIAVGGCNSVKRVLKDPVKFEQVAQEVVKKGYCINDTVTTSIVRDTTIYRDSIVRDTVEAPCPDFERTLPAGVTVKSRAGVLTVTVPVRIPVKQEFVTITNNIRDKKLESILQNDITILNGQLLESREIHKQDLEQIKKLEKQVRSAKARTWIITSLLLIVSGLFLISKLKRILP